MDYIDIKTAAAELDIPVTLFRQYIDLGLLQTSGGYSGPLSSEEYVSLKKLVLLQTLGIGVGDIQLLQAGEATLQDILKARIDAVMNNPNDTTQCAIVCQNMRRDGVTFRSFDPDPYLAHISELKARGGSFCNIVISGNTGFTGFADAQGSTGYTGEPGSAGDGGRFFGYAGSGVNASAHSGEGSPKSIDAHPYKRFLARLIDEALCLLIINLFFRGPLEINPLAAINSSIGTIWSYLIYALMFAVEPVFLHLFGTTPGKLIFGIRITDPEGGKLSWKAAWLRTFRLLRFGFGFVIPFYNIFRLVISCRACGSGMMMPWDRDTVIERAEGRSWAVPVCIIAFVLVTFADTSVSLIMEMPQKTERLTEEQLGRNITHVINYNCLSTADFPEFTTVTEGGYVRSVSFTVEDNTSDIIYEYYYPMYVLFMATAGSSSEADFMSLNYSSGILKQFENCLESFTASYAGITMTNDVSFQGYVRNVMSGYLYKNGEGGEVSFRQTFTITF